MILGTVYQVAAPQHQFSTFQYLNLLFVFFYQKFCGKNWHTPTYHTLPGIQLQWPGIKLQWSQNYHKVGIMSGH